MPARYLAQQQKAQIFATLLGKQFGVRPLAGGEACGEFGASETGKSVADITDEASLAKVRTYRQQLKAAR